MYSLSMVSGQPRSTVISRGFTAPRPCPRPPPGPPEAAGGDPDGNLRRVYGRFANWALAGCNVPAFSPLRRDADAAGAVVAAGADANFEVSFFSNMWSSSWMGSAKASSQSTVTLSFAASFCNRITSADSTACSAQVSTFERCAGFQGAKLDLSPACQKTNQTNSHMQRINKHKLQTNNNSPKTFKIRRRNKPTLPANEAATWNLPLTQPSQPTLKLPPGRRRNPPTLLAVGRLVERLKLPRGRQARQSGHDRTCRAHGRQ